MSRGSFFDVGFCCSLLAALLALETRAWDGLVSRGEATRALSCLPGSTFLQDMSTDNPARVMRDRRGCELLTYAVWRKERRNLQAMHLNLSSLIPGSCPHMGLGGLTCLLPRPDTW